MSRSQTESDHLSFANQRHHTRFSRETTAKLTPIVPSPTLPCTETITTLTLIRTTISTIMQKTGTDMNTLTVSELKRRGMAAIEDGLRSGPVHIVKRNKPAAVVLTEADYQRLAHGRVSTPSGLTAVQWLLNQRTAGKRSKAQIDAALKAERDW